MAAPQLVTLLFDAVVDAEVEKGGAMLARKLAKFLEGKVIVIDPDELHTMNINEDGSWTMGHPVACKPELFGCLFHTLAMKGFEAPHPGRWTVMLDDRNAAIRCMDLLS